MAIDYEGLNIILHGNDYYGMFMVVYRRGSLTDKFKKIIVERTFSFPATYVGLSDITKETILVIDKTSTSNNVIKVYSCGSVVVTNVEPQSGDALLSSIITEP